MIKYTDSHEWIKVDGNVGTVGITEYARKELGEIIFLEFPKIGQYLQRAKEAAVLESTKAAADVYSPVSGKVIQSNEAALASINELPESEGWLFKLEIENVAHLDTLLDRAEYLDLVK
jgi:glycine cleavage system H protein